MFRLHRSRLVQLSSYFAHLFKTDVLMPDSASDGDIENSEPLDKVGQCPVYKVNDVSVSDFEELLVAIDSAM